MIIKKSVTQDVSICNICNIQMVFRAAAFCLGSEERGNRKKAADGDFCTVALDNCGTGIYFA